MTVLVDTEKNRIVVAETNGDLIDILFSFLTLPLGTIIRLVSKNQQSHHGTTNDQPQEEIIIGCINNLYKSVEDLSDDVFWNSICKRMLLYPRNPCESLCQKLRLNVDDSEPTKYFICSSCPEGKGMMSTFVGSSCSCGNLIDKEIKLHGDCAEEGHSKDGVFVKKETLYLMFDDLRVIQSSLGNTVHELVRLGYKNINNLKHMSIPVDLKQILDLLKKALTSKTPLSDVFLENCEFGKKYSYSSWSLFLDTPYVTNLKVMVRKSKKKILYVEGDADFVDFLFNFLTTPIGSILTQLTQDLPLGCMNNLHKSARELNPSCFIRPLDNPILNPRVAPQFGYTKQPLKNLCEDDTPAYWYPYKSLVNDVNSETKKLFDPRSSYGTIESAMGFVKRPSKFIVWDNLQVTPLDNNPSSIAFLKKLNIPLDDLEEHVVTIREREALYLLESSLASSEAALTEAWFHLTIA